MHGLFDVHSLYAVFAGDRIPMKKIIFWDEGDIVLLIDQPAQELCNDKRNPGSIKGAV